MKSPFKFLDSFTKEDKEIFFGRDRETEELYQKVFESKILLVYGVSGTGKSSLIHCGLANKFNESDWLPINIRRGGDINESLAKALDKYSISEVSQQSPVNSQQKNALPTEDCGLKTSDEKSTKPTQPTKPLKKLLKNLYLDHFKPIYLIFDQFEELFIFGSKSEKEEFIQNIKKIIDSEIQCKFLFVIREEYLAGITEFEKEIPTFLQNRIRIEKMTRTNAVQCIEGPCKVHGITVEEGFSDNLLEKLSPGSTDVELTYLQVYLDKIFRESSGESFNQSILDKLGDVKDLLGSFLEEQIATLDDPDSALAILKSFVSVKGTKRQITEEEINEHCKTIGKNVELETFKKQIAHFVNIRILRDKDESGRYELRHDALAAKIYEKITLVEKELMEIRQFIENAYDNFKKRGILLEKTDLDYVKEKEHLLILNDELNQFLLQSKGMLEKQKKTSKYIIIFCSFLLILLLGVIIYFILNQVVKINMDKKAAQLQYEISDPVEQFKVARNLFNENPSIATKRATYTAFYNVFETGNNDSNYSLNLKYVPQPEPHDTTISKALFSNKGETIFCVGDDNTIILYENFGRSKRLIDMKNYQLQDIKVSPDDNYFAVSTPDSLFVFKYSGEIVFTCSLYSSYKGNNSFCFDPGCKYISVVADNNCVMLYSLKGELKQELNGHDDNINSIDISFDSKYILTASSDKSVRLWGYDQVTGSYKNHNTFSCHMDTIWSALFSKNGIYFLTACCNGNAKVISTAGEEVLELINSNSKSMKEYYETRKQRKAWFAGDERIIIQENYSYSVENRIESSSFVANCFPGEFIYLCSAYCEYKNKVDESFNCANFTDIDVTDNNSLIALHDNKTNYSTLLNFAPQQETVKCFRGGKPVFSPYNNYLLTISKKQIFLTPIEINEFKTIVSKL